MRSDRTDPLGRALAALRRILDADLRMHTRDGFDPFSPEGTTAYSRAQDELWAALEDGHPALAELERLPAAQRAGGHACWIYPDPPEAS